MDASFQDRLFQDQLDRISRRAAEECGSIDDVNLK